MRLHASSRRRLLAMSLALLSAALPGAGTWAVEEPAAQPRTHTVLIKGFKFVPPTLEVNAGDTVIWRNEDIAPHTATAEKIFDSGQLNKGESWRYVAKTQGSFSYICDFHPSMKGRLVVREK